MKRYKVLLSVVSALVLLSSLTIPAFADGDVAVEVEEVIDAVALEEAEIAEAAAQAAAEAERVNDVIDLNTESDSTASDQVSMADKSGSAENDPFSVAGPVRALITAGVLIAGGILVIAASNRKIKAGKKTRK